MPARASDPGSEPLRLTLPVPPSVNSYHRSVTTRSGVAKVLVSRAGRAWKKKALQLAAMQRPQAVEGEVAVTLRVYFPGRRRDLDNVAKPCLDLLQAAGVLANDRHVWRLVMERRIDRGNPRIEIEVRPL
ncbi:MAG TPA: RusA family crossover junction endodeoxyribonuclease [Longimicrobiaceae bacterium]|nr:RusA family crossover junction endodeoxyribonuclease [Longimicrobiaceae bacterium]